MHMPALTARACNNIQIMLAFNKTPNQLLYINTLYACTHQGVGLPSCHALDAAPAQTDAATATPLLMTAAAAATTSQPARCILMPHAL
jgi:hypothetical protein